MVKEVIRELTEKEVSNMRLNELGITVIPTSKYEISVFQTGEKNLKIFLRSCDGRLIASDIIEGDDFNYLTSLMTNVLKARIKSFEYGEVISERNCEMDQMFMFYANRDTDNVKKSYIKNIINDERLEY